MTLETSGTLTSSLRSPSSLLGHAVFRLSTLLGLLLLATLWGGTAIYLKHDREALLDSATTNATNMARVFDENVSQAIKNVDQTLLFLRRSYESNPGAFDLPAWTSSNYLLDDAILQVSLIGADGMLITTNLVKQPDKVNLSDREHFRVHADSDKDELFISKPVLGRASGKWSVQLTRRLSKPDGSFDGVLVASLNPFYLSRFFEQMNLGAKGAVTLVGEDGIIRARGGLDENVLGQNVGPSDFATRIGSAHAGSFIGIDPVSKVMSVVAYRELESFPMIVTASMAEDEVLASHAETRNGFVGLAIGITAAVFAALAYGMRREINLLRADIAQRRSERLAMQRSAELEATLSHMSQGIIMLAANGTLSLINQRARTLFGLPDAVIGLPLPVGVAALIEPSRPPLDGEVVNREVTLPNETVVEIGSTRLPDGGTLHTATDITSHKRYETVLAEARDRAESATRTRTAFLATMSHEIRTPLNGIIGMTELLEGCDDEIERAGYVSKMRRSGDHLIQVLEDVLDLSRIEAGREVFSRETFGLKETIGSVVDIASDLARQKGLTIETLIAPNTPDSLVGDPKHIRQILLNLIGNAVKFTENGGVVLRAELRQPDRLSGQPVLRLRVQDTGIGIARDDLPKLFQDFSQLDGSITRRFGGTGLGLAISRKLAQKLGGDISVESRLGAGSVFTVELPVRVAVAGGEEIAAAPPPEPRKNYTGLTILLVEDDPINTTVCKGILNRMGNTVSTAADGIEAMDALKQQRFDLVVMDVMMPRMDGLTATRKIRATVAPYAHIPIIALTADALIEDRERAFAAGMDGYTTKPVSREHLQAAIDEVMAKAGVEPAALPREGDNVVDLVTSRYADGQGEAAVASVH
jgi:signal transduction histidine kinase/CheY-like chemotaxis protein